MSRMEASEGKTAGRVATRQPAPARAAGTRSADAPRADAPRADAPRADAPHRDVTRRAPAGPAGPAAGARAGRSQRAASAADPTAEELAARLRVAVHRLDRRLRQEAIAGLSPSQTSVLGTISRLGSPTLGTLAEAEQVQPPTMTRLVGGLQAAGLVKRTTDAGDARVAHVRLTADGRRALERIRTLKTAFLARRLASLDAPERAASADLIALLERLVDES
jgi:DNA-binding MarR family transcriptional regulator